MENRPQLTDEQYRRFRDLILERTGLLFGPPRRYALGRGVLAAAEQSGWKDLEGYYLALRRTGTPDALWDELIGRISIGETYFFRNRAHFELLRREILPGLIARHQIDRHLRIWCAGCASGEEPYSVAILLRQLLPDITRWDIFILGTDINHRALNRAREGRYRAWSFRDTEPAIRERYFVKQGKEYEVKPEVRKMLTFAYLNLVQGLYPSPSTNTHAMDLILCRNVAIYLPQRVMRDIAARFYDSLVLEGWLIVGAHETGNDLYEPFEVRRFPGATLYQKGGPKREAPEPSPVGETSPTPAEIPLQVPAPAPPSPSESPPLHTPPMGVEHYREGLRLLEEGKREEALERFLSCIRHDPTAVSAYGKIARIHIDQGRVEKALQWCERALEQDPVSVEARYLLALIHLQSGSTDKAVSELKKILYLDPDHIPAHLALANLYWQTGRADQASRHRVQVLRLAARMPPDCPMPGAEGLTAGQFLSRSKAMA